MLAASQHNSRAVLLGIAVGRQASLATLDVVMNELCRADIEI